MGVTYVLCIHAICELSNLRQSVLLFKANILQCNNTTVGLRVMCMYYIPHSVHAIHYYVLVKCGAILKFNLNLFTSEKQTYLSHFHSEIE